MKTLTVSEAAEGAAQKLSPREALRLLQQNARLRRQDAENYLDEVRAERLAAEKSAA